VPFFRRSIQQVAGSSTLFVLFPGMRQKFSGFFGIFFGGGERSPALPASQRIAGAGLFFPCLLPSRLDELPPPFCNVRESVDERNVLFFAS